jgi:hypothetical protein
MEFKMELTGAENEGSRAAELLEEAVQENVRLGALRNQDIRIVVHVYADLASLSKQRFKRK